MRCQQMSKDNRREPARNALTSVTLRRLGPAVARPSYHAETPASSLLAIPAVLLVMITMTTDAYSFSAALMSASNDSGLCVEP